MAERPAAGRRSERLDRVSKPEAGRPRRDVAGKEALYSTSPSAPPTSHVLVICERCDVERGLSLLEILRLLKPPFVWNPLRGKLWARCPTCDRRSWLRIRKGQELRALLDRGAD